MAIEIINVGTSANDGTGDALRNAFIKCNDNFDELDFTKQDELVSGTNIKTIEGQSLIGPGNIDLTKSDVGLGNVDNTSDLNKPISTATQTALNAKQNTLVSGTNIKTINGNSILGSGDLTISGGISGSGTTNYIPKFTGASALGNSQIFDNGSSLLIGTTTAIYGTNAKVQILHSYLEFGLNFRSNNSDSIPIHFVNNSGTQVGYIFSSTTSVNYTSVSDYRLKEDLNKINGLDLISVINVYDYKWKSGDKRSFGVMAHELQEVIPQAVFGEKDGERMQSVDYSMLVPILIQAIKEQQTQIQELKNLIK